MANRTPKTMAFVQYAFLVLQYCLGYSMLAMAYRIPPSQVYPPRSV